LRRNKPVFKFLLIGFGVYISWLSFHEFYLKPRTHFDQSVIHAIVSFAEFHLSALGQNTQDLSRWNHPYKRHIALENSKVVTVGAPCDGVILYALFVCFIFAFPGPVRHKIWFMPAGIAILFWMNTLRVISLAWIAKVDESWLQFNHDYTFTVFVYSIEFLLWMLWVKFYSSMK
jgi:exosortase family protein XrtF